MLRRGYHRSKTSRTHHTDIASTSLAAGQTTSWIQDCQLGIPSADKQSTWLSGRRYSSRLRKFCSLHQVLFGEKVLCHSCSQSFWWHVLLQLDHWNNLPASLRDKEVSCTEFRRQLKTFMFQTDCGASWLLITAPHKYSYLLTCLLSNQTSWELDPRRRDSTARAKCMRLWHSMCVVMQK